jgi:DNA-binding LacI/PurR family transcriptional regulator
MQYLKRLGLRVPEDLAIVGMDNTYLTEMLSPGLTSVEFSKEEFSRKLVDTMLMLINGEEVGDEFINVSLSAREST